MLETKSDFRTWLFGLDSFKKRFIQITFDGLVSPIALLLAFFIRLETTGYLYQIDTYIGVLIVTVTTLSAFVLQGQYNNVTRHISIEAACKIFIGSILSCAVLLFCISLFGLEIPRSISPIDLCNAFVVFFRSQPLFCTNTRAEYD